MQQLDLLPPLWADPFLAPSRKPLPHDLIKSTLDYLPEGELLMARLVNTGWRKAVADCVECFFGEKEKDGRLVGRWSGALENGHFTPWSPRQLRMVLCVMQDTTLTFQQHGIRGIWLSLSCGEEGDKTVAGIARSCPQLTVALLGFCKVTDLAVSSLAAMPQLVELSLSDTIITSVAPLSACRTLKKLHLERCNNLTDISGLGALPLLEELYLTETEIGNVGHLSASRSLRCLILAFCPFVADGGIRGLEAIPTLEELDLRDTKVTRVAQFAASRSLRKLKIGGCLNATDFGVAGLEAIPTLEELDLNKTSITRVTRFSASQSLKRLDIGSTPHLTDAGIAGLERIPTLEELNLSDTTITSVAHLSGCRCLRKLICRCLRKLILRDCSNLTDIVGLESFLALEELDLSGTKVSDVTQLTASRSLKKLWIEHCPNLTLSALAAIESIPTLGEYNLGSTSYTRVPPDGWKLSSCDQWWDCNTGVPTKPCGIRHLMEDDD